MAMENCHNSVIMCFDYERYQIMHNSRTIAAFAILAGSVEMNNVQAMEKKGELVNVLSTTCPSIEKVKNAIPKVLSARSIMNGRRMQMPSIMVDETNFFKFSMDPRSAKATLSPDRYDDSTSLDFEAVNIDSDFISCLYSFTRKDNGEKARVRVDVNLTALDAPDVMPNVAGYKRTENTTSKNVFYFADSPENISMSWSSPEGWNRSENQLDQEFGIEKTVSPFEILGLPKTASWEEVESAYKKLALINHPDKGGNEEEFKKISGAHDELKNRFGK